jgi:acylglycerol lipase
MNYPLESGLASQPQVLFTPDGLRLYSQSWQPNQSRASVVIVHGYAEHSGRYAHVAAHLVRQGLAVYSLDLRGHGQSEGEPGLIRRFADFWLDLETVWAQVPTTQPVFLLAHSMGTLVALGFLLQARPAVAGLITTGTVLAVDQDVPKWRIQAVTALSQLWPHLPVARLSSREISRDPAVVTAYDRDPLVYRGPVKAKTAVELFGAARQLRTRIAQLDLPVLALHGTEDRLAPVAGSQRLISDLPTADKTLRLYAGLAHELLNEPEQQQILTEMTIWLEAHLPPSPNSAVASP